MIFKFTGNTAIKKINELNLELNHLREQERNRSIYTYIEGETPVVPEYSVTDTWNAIDKISQNIMLIKSALHRHNMEHRGKLTNKTINEILVWMPIVNTRLMDMSRMRSVQPKSRITRNNVSEWSQINFDPKDIEAEYKYLNSLLTNLQEDVNYLNVNYTFEVDLID